MWDCPCCPTGEGAACLHGAAAQWRGGERTAAELARRPCFQSYFEMFLISLLQGNGCWGEQDWGNESEGV